MSPEKYPRLTSANDGSTFFDVPSENDQTLTSGDRRTRKRIQRRDLLLTMAADLVDDRGIDGLTMAALAEAADYATASLYTYFPSRSALLAALQERALETLGGVAQSNQHRWTEALAASPEGSRSDVAALAQLCAFGDLLLSAPRDYPREFRLQQQLLVSADAEETADAAGVVPSAMRVLEVPRQLLAAAVETGALDAPDEVLDPLGEPVDGALHRTFTWLLAMNGTLMIDGLVTGAVATGAQLGRNLTLALLRGWGAEPAAVVRARSLADEILSKPGEQQ